MNDKAEKDTMYYGKKFLRAIEILDDYYQLERITPDEEEQLKVEIFNILKNPVVLKLHTTFIDQYLMSTKVSDELIASTQYLNEIIHKCVEYNTRRNKFPKRYQRKMALIVKNHNLHSFDEGLNDLIKECIQHNLQDCPFDNLIEDIFAIDEDVCDNDFAAAMARSMNLLREQATAFKGFMEVEHLNKENIEVRKTDERRNKNT